MAAQITLTVIEDGLPEREYVFDSPVECLVGRATDCDIQIAPDLGHGGISRHHCAFEIHPPSIGVRDLGSLNGTYVNEERIGKRQAALPPEGIDPNGYGRHELKNGDEVRLGHTLIRVNLNVMSEQSDPSCFPTGLPWLI